MSLEKITIGKITYDPSTQDNFTGIYNGTIRNEFKIKVRLVNDEKVNKTEVEDFLKLNSNPNVQRIFEYYFQNSIHYFGMQNFDITLKEYVTGLKNRKSDRIQIIRDITKGLQFLHNNKIYHGNISFNNIGIDAKTKCAILCNRGFDDIQEQIFQAPEQFLFESSSFKADIFSLGIIIYYILSCGSHPFGSFDNKTEIIKAIKLLKLKYGFENLKYFLKSKNNKPNYIGECALSLLREILTKDAEIRPNCDALLEHPLFWSTFEIYEYFKKIGFDWSKLTTDDINMINRKSKKYFVLRSWGDQLQKFIKNENFSLEEKQDFVCLVKFVAKKIKHFEENLNTEDFKEENLLLYLDEFPYLLKFVYNVNKRIKIVEDETINEKIIHDESNAPSSSGRTNDNKNLYELCVKHGIPTTSAKLISENDVQCNGEITKSKNKAKSKLFNGIYKGVDVAIKMVDKNEKPENIANEIRSFAKLKSSVKSCCKDKICENIIQFIGCYEDQNNFCFVLEKAEMDFENLLEEFKKQNERNPNLKASNDERVKRILHQVIKGLECIHANSVYHLDIKPKNILIVKRNNKEIGCLADFGSSKCGESVRHFTSRFDVSQYYVAPELKILLNKPKKHIIDYKKCDIFSFGIVFTKDYLGYLLDTDKILSKVELEKYRDEEKISLLSVELAIVITNHDHKKRPYAEAVRKNPYFWSTEKKFKFLRDVHYFACDRHETDKEVMKSIERSSLRLFNPTTVKNSGERFSWLDFLKTDIIMYNEIQSFIEDEDEEIEELKKKPKPKKNISNQDNIELQKIKKEESAFFLIKVIISIYDQPDSNKFNYTRQKLKVSNIEEYLNFWLKKFELIAFFHNKMQNYMEKEYEDYFSILTTKRNLGSRRFLSRSIDLPDFKRNISENSSSESSQNQSKRSKM